MTPHDIAEALEHPAAQDLLTSATLLRLAYNGTDGFPRAVPTGFYWNGNEIVVCTAATAPKVKALSSRPNVALTIDTGDTPADAKALLVRGLARVEIVDGVPDEYIAGARKVHELQTRSRSSRARSGRCTTGWHASPSSRRGRGSSTSARAASRRS